MGARESTGATPSRADAELALQAAQRIRTSPDSPMLLGGLPVMAALAIVKS